MSCALEYAPLFRRRGFRLTPQRLAVLHALRRAEGRLSPAEALAFARKEAPGLTEPTVYRALQFFVENGLAWAFQNKNGRVSYELARHEHHHLICRACGQEWEVSHEALKLLYKKLEAQSGYQLFESHQTFFGLCPRCKNKLEKKG